MKDDSKPIAHKYNHTVWLKIFIAVNEVHNLFVGLLKALSVIDELFNVSKKKPQTKCKT